MIMVLYFYEKGAFCNRGVYHIYNRGVDKRTVFSDEFDIERFLQSMEEFNTVDPIGSIYQQSFVKAHQLRRPTSKLVCLVAYCLNPNHYHLLLKQKVDGGISEFIKRLSGGYTRYFNDRHKRSGVLFQGRFKSVYINSNEYLLHLSAYVNLNNKVHKIGSPASKLIRSSWNEYFNKSEKVFCEKEIILDQFNNVSGYKEYAESTLESVLNKRNEQREKIAELLLE